ncbi:pyruvate oxidase [Latilactobacillus sakei]|jgi:pyruvate oxidase|uniref:Pyruvate oxidase n=1 Tax=Latilactobacillus sakei TaxID=1599 RepID=A0A223K4Q3_LATSK|nr:pyruvate oxidase [Latilactobacillus sakei]AST84358.1 pyruvate oxidase [Latilactobacillus sakei]AWZ42306.1 pyruvate oxidase [Latilactobacillus sakei]AWZ45024.1 pyruvate oxidase [Latilactobacillus sakei]AWZ46524.1 pyruvate oxidase [Latilactobacillus sakei]AYG15688.1 pyruvate oxidase [Latilactobacillus sakei]
MVTQKINAADAMLKVMADWGIDHIFGLPGGSFDSTMNALHNQKAIMRYIQVRHEEVGALAASGEAKVTGKIAATFGSAGPGAVHLLNGLYDAKYDHVPVLALVGQVATGVMNTDYFQEMNENPMFADVAVYNRTVMTAEQLPLVVDQAIQQAYKNSGVAVVTIPTDLGWQPIEDHFEATANLFQMGNYPEPRSTDIQQTLQLIKEAKQPIIYFGQGAKAAGDELVALSDKLSIPMMSSALSKGIVADENPAYMVSAGRVATKPGVDLAEAADLILFVGSNYEFGQYFFKPDAKFIQIDIDPTKLGHRHHVDVGILADAKTALAALLEASEPVSEKTAFYRAAVANKANWDQWTASFEDDPQTPLRVEPVFKEINQMATNDAIFNLDVGNVTIDGVRFLKMKPGQKTTISAWYATMGAALPAAIGTQAAFPDRQVWSISGDGGFTMVMQDLITQVKYQMPIINVVLSNDSFGFIEAEQDDKGQPHSGVAIQGADYGATATALGAQGFTVRTLDELKAAFAAAQKRQGPVVIDVKIANERPLPVEQLVIDDQTQDPEAVAQFIEKYRAQGLKPFRTFLG